MKKRRAITMPSEREIAIKRGRKERVTSFITLYWELYYDDQFDNAFTVDVEHGGALRRYRCKTLAEADAKIESLKLEFAVDIAKAAFGL